ncbi:DUF6119 family protein [Listeria booriae]|uniref:DUF6119 family protein n=1 Tax=Listeria booriae TaxID=1552123 RepID=UPI001624E97C|nr:DUF6119 family protein [Listeria booriae]MBC2106432.1 TIGR04141 family sporadically distributed protein [Listeria booriae]
MDKSKLAIYKLDILEDKSISSVAKKIIKDYQQEQEFKYRKKTLTSVNDERFQCELYIRIQETLPTWAGFVRDIVKKANGMNLKNRTHSFILFVKYNQQYFAIAGGLGYQVIRDYKTENYGMEILSKIIEPHEAIIESYDNLNFTGKILKNSSTFRKKASLNHEQELTKFFKNIEATLTGSTLGELLGVATDANHKERYKCVAKDSFMLSKPLNLNDMKILIEHLVNLEQQDTKCLINQFKPIKKKSDKYSYLVNKLDTVLFGNMLKLFCDEIVMMDEDNILGQDFKSVEFYLARARKPFYTSKEYLAKDSVDKITDSAKIEGMGKNTGLNLSCKDIKVKISDDLNNEYIMSFLDIIITTINEDGITYFLFNGNFYYSESNFMDTINKTFSEIVALDTKFTMKKWVGGQKEGEYNLQYIDEPDTYVMDRIFVNNIELCDILMIKEEVYLIHVKKGFENEVRTLSQQVLQAAQLIKAFREENDIEIIEAYYNSIKRKSLGRDENLVRQSNMFDIELDDFKNILKNKDINFVFAFSKEDFDQSEPERLKSAIAKLSTIDLVKSMSNIGMNLMFVKIETE